MITGIVSGGQTGADQAGLRAARKLHLKTGGYAPRRFKTDCGEMAWLGPTFGLIELDSDDYSIRTELNVSLSDGTVIFGKASSGSNLTQQLCRDLGKPCLWLQECEIVNAAPHFRLWIERNHIALLNVAGNRERIAVGIGLAVERFLVSVIPTCK